MKCSSISTGLINLSTGCDATLLIHEATHENKLQDDARSCPPTVDFLPTMFKIVPDMFVFVPCIVVPVPDMLDRFKKHSTTQEALNVG